MSFTKNNRPNRMQKPGKRVLIGETREEEAAPGTGDSRASRDSVRTWRAKPDIIPPGLEQQAVHSTLGANRRRGHR
jgi:hypothetical protein